MAARTRVPDTGDLWRLTMEHSPVGMTLVSPEGEFLTANTALCDMLGYEPAEMARLTVQDITHPDDLDLDLRLIRDILAGRINSYRISKRYIRADGSVLVGDLSVALLRDEVGDPIHFISQIVDLSERQAFVERLDAAEEAAEALRRKTHALFESVTVGLLLVDADGQYSAFNRRQQEFLDIAFPGGHLGHAGQGGLVYDADQLRTLTPAEFPCARATADEDFDDMLIWIGGEPASRRALSVSARTVHDRSGTLTSAVLAYNDVTELMRAIQVKDEFVASVTHELRTPLTSALAHLELLDDAESLPPDARAQVAAVRRNAMRLSHLVADLLYSATATSGAQLIDPFRVDLSVIVGEAVEAARPDADGAGVSLSCEAPEALSVMADGFRVRQVADNLITNAIQYTLPGGRVQVVLSADDDVVRLVVADSGEGIEESDLDHLFSKFVRGQNATRRLVPGTGLGLNIVRTIVEAHGGEVSLESTAGVGTTVRVTLPR